MTCQHNETAKKQCFVRRTHFFHEGDGILAILTSSFHGTDQRHNASICTFDLEHIPLKFS